MTKRDFAAGRRLVEPGHRRVQPGRTPEEVGADPSGVEPELVVVEAVEGEQPVGEVGDEQQRDAGGQEVERRLAPARVQGQPHDGADQDHVADRIRDRDDLAEQGQVVEVQVRRHQRDPRREREADGEDQAVDEVVAVRAGAAAPEEQQQPRHHHGVHRHVERVPGRGERDLRAEQMRIAVGVEVAEPEQGRAAGQQEPRQPRRRPVPLDPQEDREHRRQADQVHQRAAALEGRDRQVEPAQDRPGDQVDGPGRGAPPTRGGAHVSDRLPRRLRPRSAASRAPRAPRGRR